MNDETVKTNDPARAPDAQSPSTSPAQSGTPPTKPAATEVQPKQVEYRDKPSDASKTQDKDAGTAPRTSGERPDEKKPNDPQRQQDKPSTQNPKAPMPEGQARPGDDKNMPAKTPDAKPQVAPVVVPKAV